MCAAALAQQAPATEEGDPAGRDRRAPARRRAGCRPPVPSAPSSAWKGRYSAPRDVEQPEEAEQERLDEEEPDERADERSHLAVHDRADRDAHQQPEDNAEERLAGPLGDVRVGELEVAAVDRHPDRRDRDDDDERQAAKRPRQHAGDRLPRERARVPASPAASA